MTHHESKWRSFRPTLDDLPREPGVYCIYFDDEIVYVGQSNNLYARLKRHNFRRGYGGNIHTPWSDSVPASTKITGKYKVSERLGDWAMWEIRLIHRLGPKFNLTYLNKRRTAS